MHHEHVYLYAFTEANCTLNKTVPGVDPRFNVELLRRGLLAAVASRIGLDEFDTARLKGKTADDARWAGSVAQRHNRVICEVAKCSPVLPMKLGTLFRSRSALLAKMAQCEATVADFLSRLGDRQEWAAGIYLGVRWAEATPRHSALPSPHYATGKESLKHRPTKKSPQQRIRPASDRRLLEEVLAVETALKDHADRWCRVDSASSDSVGLHEGTAWNAAFLLPRAEEESWLAAVERLRRDVAAQGLLLEVTGPWPPFHFCPSLDT